MERNARNANDLRDDEGERHRVGGEMDEALPPPFTLSPLGADPTLGWAGWGAGTMAGWTRAQAELWLREAAEGEVDRPRREPRKA